MELFKLFGTIGLNGVDQTKRDIEDTAGTAERSESKFTGAFKKIGAAVATYFAVDKIVQFGKAIVDASAEVSAEASAFEQIMGDYADEASAKLGKIADATGVVDTRLTPYMTSMTAKFKGLGYDIDEATTLASDGLTLASDAAAFWDKSLDDAMGGLNSFINGSYEGGEAIGLFANDTQLASYAVKQGIVAETKEWANLDEAKKQATRLQYAEDMYKASGATGQAAKEADQYANVQANLTEEWRQFKATIGEPVLQALLPVLKSTGDGIKYVNDTLKNSDNLFAGFSKLFTDLISNLDTAIPQFTAKAKEMMSQFGTKIKESLPDIISNGLDIVTGFSETILENVPQLVSSGMDMLKNIAQGVIDSIPTLIEKVPQIVTNFANTINESMPIILSKGAEIIWNLIQGIIGAIPTLIANIPKIFEAILAVWNAIAWVDLGKSLMTNIWNGIKSLGTMLKSGVEGIFNGLKTSVGNIFTGLKNTAVNIWNALKSGVSNIVTGLKNTAVNIFNALKSGVEGIFNGIKTFASNIWNGIKSVISGAIEGAKNTVSNVVNGIKNTVSNVFNGIKNTATTVWNGIRDAIKKPIEKARDLVSGAIDKIKGFFDFKISWPKIPMPHFSIKPQGWSIGDLLKGSIPSLGISWYAKGGIFDEPTIFPTATGFKGVGEAGAEAVTPIDTLLDYVRQATREENARQAVYIQRLIDMLADYLPQLVNGMDRPIVLEDGTLVSRLAPQIDEALGDIQRGRGRGQ